MSVFVVDASVVIKWFVPEIHTGRPISPASPWKPFSTRGLMIDAQALAVTTGLIAYDAMYLALAVRLKTELITADDRLSRTVAARPMTAAHVRLVQTFE